MSPLLEGFLFYFVFLFSTTLHEAAHAWAALRGGDATAYDGGQLTLNPLPHIRREPIGMVVLPIASVLLSGWPLGFASAPYNRKWAAEHPKRAGWMALAGPGGNLLLVLLAAFVIRAGTWGGVFEAPVSIRFADVVGVTAGAAAWWHPVGYLLGAVFVLNLLLGAFNLLPFPPLDGSGALVLLMPRAIIARYQGFLWTYPQFSWLGIVIAWRVFGGVFSLVHTIAINLLYPGVTYG
jgi:Zn-dependent protease